MSKHKLILGPLPDDYDSQSDRIVSLLTVVGCEDRLQNWAELPLLKCNFDQRAFLSVTEAFLNGTVLPQLTATLNAPFIIIIPKSIAYARESEDVFNELRVAGIAFDCPVLAAQAINERANIREWWASAPVQAARLNWVNRYARTSKTPFKDWAKLLWRL